MSVTRRKLFKLLGIGAMLSVVSVPGVAVKGEGMDGKIWESEVLWPDLRKVYSDVPISDSKEGHSFLIRQRHDGSPVRQEELSAEDLAEYDQGSANQHYRTHMPKYKKGMISELPQLWWGNRRIV